MTQKSGHNCFFILICLLVSACSGTRHLPAGEKLYTGAEIKFESSDKIAKRKLQFIKNTAKTALRPEPNKKILGTRRKVWMYMAAGEQPKTKYRKWLLKKGEAPVLISSIKPDITSAIIDSKLYNIGIFKSVTGYKIIEKKRTAKVVYTSSVHQPYIIKSITYSVSNDSISRLIIAEKEKSIIKAGDDYDLDKLKFERTRIDDVLKNHGYFFFNPDYLLFKAETSNVSHSVALKMVLKDSLPENVLKVYRINRVYVDQDYSLNAIVGDSIKDTIRYKNIMFLGKESNIKIRPKIIAGSVFLRKNEIYSRTNHNITLNRLMSMGSFKFVSVKFVDSDTAATGYLDVKILLTSLPKHTTRAEIDVVSKSDNNLGPRLNLGFLNRNTFNGAEILTINMAGSFEAQLSGTNKNLFSYSINPQMELSFPRFLLPFRIINNSIFVPKTRFMISYNYLKKVNYFDLNTFQFIYGYKWKKNIRAEHELNPVQVSFTSVTNKSAVFNDLLVSNPFLKKSYEEQFIAGGSYSYTYNEQVLPQKRMQYYFQSTVEVAGNIFSLITMIGGRKISSSNPAMVAGSVFSQYGKVTFDGRAYYNFRSKNKLALRAFIGVANPYGNSSTLPYTKQFFSGGPNSLRAFHINSVGPGTFQQNANTNGFLQLGGDMKLEANAEYRFTIYRYFKGAVFMDAGNVWQLSSNPSHTGDPFSFSRFMNEIALGTGVGLRIDVSFFIIRFDLAMPLLKPWLDNNRWVLNQINFGNNSWRRDNLILNVAIGYPF
jgi:outer membrane protein assembly factor BamA